MCFVPAARRFAPGKKVMAVTAEVRMTDFTGAQISSFGKPKCFSSLKQQFFEL
jgi:hypothetical protein